MIACVEVRLTIPDNEARTAQATLQRLGVAVARLERADVYRCETVALDSRELLKALRGFETIYNPNKHVIGIRAGDRPEAGEVWIDETGRHTTPVHGIVRIAGRTLPGVRSLERFVAWRMWSEAGVPADAAKLSAATETLLCNFAFQKAIRA